MTLVGLIEGKDMGPSTGSIAALLPRVLTVFIRALDETGRSILLLCYLDWYWSSVRPPNMKLMVGRGSDGCSGLPICSSGRLPNVSSEVPSPNQFFY